eukprot:906237-Pleurochrysis_carterae.AAC.2
MRAAGGRARVGHEDGLRQHPDGCLLSPSAGGGRADGEGRDRQVWRGCGAPASLSSSIRIKKGLRQFASDEGVR